jgi:hypothetical protein
MEQYLGEQIEERALYRLLVNRGNNLSTEVIETYSPAIQERIKKLRDFESLLEFILRECLHLYRLFL